MSQEPGHRTGSEQCVYLRCHQKIKKIKKKIKLTQMCLLVFCTFVCIFTCLLVFCTYLFVVKSYTSHVAVRPSWLTPPTTTILPLWMTAPNIALGVFMAAISLHSDCLWLYENILFKALLWREGRIRSGHVPGPTDNFSPQICHFLLCLLLAPVWPELWYPLVNS